MPRYATVAPHLPVDDLAIRYRQAHDPVARTHWQIVWLVAQGHHVPEVAQLVGYTANWVRAIIRRYNADGPDALVDQRSAHQPALAQSGPHDGAGRGRRRRPRMAASGAAARPPPG